MCFTSAVMREYDPFIPRPNYDQWKTREPWEPTKSPSKGTIKLDPTQLKELLDSFHNAVKAAQTFDRITGQPDCVDPEKAKLEDRVTGLEGILSDIKKVLVKESNGTSRND